jgi:hypothetical protein
VRVASGVKTTDTSITFAGNVTLSAVATAVNALGNGWSAQVVGDVAGQGDYGKWPSADLYVQNSYGDPLEGAGVQTNQGAMNCRGQNAELKMHTFELQGFQWDARGWLLRAIPYTDPELLHPEDLIFPVGINNFRVQYTAGYSTVPESVQEACARWVADCYYRAQRDPQLRATNTAGIISQTWTLDEAGGGPPMGLRPLLAPYRRYSVGINQS